MLTPQNISWHFGFYNINIHCYCFKYEACTLTAAIFIIYWYFIWWEDTFQITILLFCFYFVTYKYCIISSRC